MYKFTAEYFFLMDTIIVDYQFLPICTPECTVRLKYLAQELNTITQAKYQTQTASSRVQRANHRTSHVDFRKEICIKLRNHVILLVVHVLRGGGGRRVICGIYYNKSYFSLLVLG